MATREAKLHQLLLTAYAGDAELLSDPASSGRLPVPSIKPNVATFPKPWFRFVGRSCFKDLRAFVEGFMEEAEEGLYQWGMERPAKDQAEPPAQLMRPMSYAGSEAYVIGTPGEGKSYMLAALAGFLHSRGKYVVIYISALSFCRYGSETLRSSLMVAFARDDTALAELASTRDKKLLAWLRSKPKLMILVDDYNELDGKRTLHPQSKSAQTVQTALANLAGEHAVIYCCSCSTEVRPVLERPPHPPYLVIAGGFSEKEFETFQSRVVPQKNIPSSTLEQTGYNPRLLNAYVEGTLELALLPLRKSLRRFILELNEFDYGDFVQELAGGEVTLLPKAMDTRCFYVSADRELTAISDHFKSAALSLCAARDVKQQRETVEEHIGYFTRVVKLDDGKNTVRLGWNAEEATLLVLSKIPVTIPLVGCSWNFEASVVKVFRGGIELDAGMRSIVHLPREFNCQAVDALLEGTTTGKTVCAGVQISASKDPEASHKGAIAHFCSVMKAATVRYEILVFIWIGYFPGNFPPRKVTVDGVELTEVTMSFSQLCPWLSDLDDVCQKVRRLELQANQRRSCHARTAQGKQCTLTVKRGRFCHVHIRQEKKRKRSKKEKKEEIAVRPETEIK